MMRFSFSARTLAFGVAALVPLTGAPARYSFGDDMMNFVVNEAGPAARHFLASDLGARSLNGFLVTLDVARAAANDATRALVRTDTVVDDAQRVVSTLYRSDGRLAIDALSMERVAEIAALATRLRAATGEIAYHWESVGAAHRTLTTLDSAFSPEQFRNRGLHLEPLYFIRSSIADTRPALDAVLSINLALGGADDAGANATNVGFFLFDLWNTEKERREYEKQQQKYEQALRDLPRYLPSESETYAAYLDGYTKAEQIAGHEAARLAPHLDTLRGVLQARFDVTGAAQAALDDALLSERVRSSYARLGLDDLLRHPSDAFAVRNAALDLRDTRRRIERLQQIARSDAGLARTFNALEDVEEAAAAVDSFVTRIDSIPVYQPVRVLLRDLRPWFVAQGAWATMSLALGTVGSLQQPRADKSASWSRLDALANVEQGTALLAHTGQRNAPSAADVDPRYMLSVTRPGFGGSEATGSAYHEAYPGGGAGVWGRTTDGAFATDVRHPGGAQLGHVRDEIAQRTTRTEARYAAALVEMRAAEARRVQEIGEQATRVATSAAATTRARVIVPPRGTAITRYARGRPSPLEIARRHRTMDAGYDVRLSIERARQDLLITREGIPIGDAEKTREYRRLHGEYLAAAEAFWRAKHPEQAEDLFDSAIAIRAWLRGYATTGVHLASFNPLFPVQTLVQMLGQKFPLERPISAEGLEPKRLCIWDVDRIPACNRRTAEVLELIYGYTGFHNPSSAVRAEVGSEGFDLENEDGRPVLRAQGILKYALGHPDEWQHLGNGTSAAVLSQAQRLANLGVAVIAVSMTHVAPVMPGEMRRGGSFADWVPNIYNSVKGDGSPTASYYYGPLNWAWSKPADVQFFALWNGR